MVAYSLDGALAGALDECCGANSKFSESTDNEWPGNNASWVTLGVDAR